MGALQYIDRLGLYGTVFADPTKDHGYCPPSNWAVAYQCLARIKQSEDPHHNLVSTMTIHDAEEAYTSWIISAMVPYADAPETKPAKAGSKAPPPVAAQVVREAIKATNKIFDVVTASVKNMEEIKSLKDKFVIQQKQPHKKQEGDDATARDTIGMAIRKWGQTWRSQALFALLHEVLTSPEKEQGWWILNSIILAHLTCSRNHFIIRQLVQPCQVSEHYRGLRAEASYRWKDSRQSTGDATRSVDEGRARCCHGMAATQPRHS